MLMRIENSRVAPDDQTADTVYQKKYNSLKMIEFFLLLAATMDCRVERSSRNI
jgi:hypothetical protein